MSHDMDSKVIGYFAFIPPNQVICEGDACVIAGSEEAIKNYIRADSSNKPTIKKTRFGEIIKGMKMGAPYAFDEQAYNRFYPLANKIGFSLKEEDFSGKNDASTNSAQESGFHFVVIR